MDIYTQMAEKIIEEQERIIGPIAYEQAAKVSGLVVDRKKHAVAVDGKDKTAIIESLVEQYKALFGQASVEACKEAVKSLLPKLSDNQIPPLLH